MDDRYKLTTHLVSRQPETYLHSRTTEVHRCYFGSAGHCSCGKHRAPACASGISALATDRERLAVEL